MVAVESPVGTLWLGGDEHGLHTVSFTRLNGVDCPGPVAGEAREQLLAYFAGALDRFDLRLAPRGTPFQREVWDAVANVPYGATTTYAQVAVAVGRPRACRAVGAANGRNPLSIVVPCHRVVGSAGALTGYGGGLVRKRALLDLEAAGRYVGAGVPGQALAS